MIITQSKSTINKKKTEKALGQLLSKLENIYKTDKLQSYSKNYPELPKYQWN